MKSNMEFSWECHGKGDPDGEGGALKRTANNFVLHGHAITDAASFICKTQEQDTSVYLYEVHENEILNKSYGAKFKPITGTYKINQIENQKLGKHVSCLCLEGEIHPGHEWEFAKIAENNHAKESAEIARPQKRRTVCKTNKITKDRVRRT